MANKPLIELHPDYLDGHHINWDLASYLFEVSRIFEPALLASDSDSFTVGDSLSSFFNLLYFVLTVNPGKFKAIHQELILSMADYIFGADKTGRKPARGQWIRSRANPAALVGYSLEYFSRNFDFRALGKRIEGAHSEDGFITDETHKVLTTCVKDCAKEWRTTVKETIALLASRLPDAIDELPKRIQPKKQVR